MSASKPWSEEDDQLLTECLASGKYKNILALSRANVFSCFRGKKSIEVHARSIVLHCLFFVFFG